MRNASHVRARAALAAAAMLLLVILAACSRRSSDASQPSVAYGTDQAESVKAQYFTVPADQMAHVQVVRVETSTLQRTLRLTGSVAYNAFETTPVITQVSGVVARVLAFPGETVRAGQPLLEVASPDYAQARTNYLKTRDASALAEKNYQRAQDLYAHQAIAQADLQASETARNQAQADLQAAEQTLKVLGISNLDSVARGPSSAQIPLRAPIGGEVVERLVSPGQVIQAGATQCFTISNLSTVWVLANVYQQDLAYVHIGDPVDIHTDAYPDAFHGRISYLAPALDPNTRTLQVRIVTSNPGERLKKDMYVTATVQAAAIQNALIIPDAAVLRDAENHPFVYLEVAGGEFAQRPVSVGESQEGRTQVLSGLRAGERVAGDGSLFLQFANSLQR